MVVANYVAAASWAAAAAAPDALFLLPLLLPRRQFVFGWSCVLISLIIGETTATGNFTYMQTLVDSERFLIDDWDDHLYEYTFSALRQDLCFGHVLDRAILEGQKQHVHTRFCPSNLAMGQHLLRTVRCRGDGNCGYHSLLNGICHLRGQLPTNTALSASIVCQRCSSFQILSSVSVLQHVHASLYSRCTGVCICTCALRQTPHGHIRRGVVGSVCVRMYSVCVLCLRNTFRASCTPCSGVHCRATRPQHTCAFLIAAYATLYPTLCLYRLPNTSILMQTFVLKARVAGVLVDHATAGRARSVADLRQQYAAPNGSPTLRLLMGQRARNAGFDLRDNQQPRQFLRLRAPSSSYPLGGPEIH